MNSIASPNFDARPADCTINTLVMHYTDTKTTQEALDILCDHKKKVSAHYVVEQNGNMIALVDEKDRAWHAGVSHWRGRNHVNDVSIGVELVNPGERYGYCAFPQEQMHGLIELCQGILKRHKIPARNVVAHSDIAPDRKIDPGELFDWQQMAEAGIGLWPDMQGGFDQRGVVEIGMARPQVGDVQKKLQKFGYGIKVDGYFGVQMSYVVEAFQRHFIQTRLDGVWDEQCDKTLDWLLEKV